MRSPFFARSRIILGWCGLSHGRANHVRIASMAE